MSDVVSLRPDQATSTIAPEIYGHFAEHLGRCIYGGVWDNSSSKEELRHETIELLRELNPPIVRWPGGCFASDYYWEDGVGPREERPRRRNTWWVQTSDKIPEESNAFGTKEFIHFCRSIGAEPYLALNVGSGSVREAANWIEYCNYDGDTEYANLRRQHGSHEPHNVRYWALGNEAWGCGGRHDPSSYARECRRFTNTIRYLDRFITDELHFVASGHTNDGWNKRFLQRLGDAAEFYDRTGFDLIDSLSIHRYYESGPETDFSDAQYYRLFTRAAKLADDIDKAVAVIESIAPDSNIGVVVDEWGAWHENCVAEEGLEQANTVRDAVVAAGVFDIFNARCDVLMMTNISQMVNVLQCVVETDESEAWPTPTYQVFEMYKPHRGAEFVPSTVETELRSINGADRDLPMLSASASITDGDLCVTLSNRDLTKTRTVLIDIGTQVTSPQAHIAFADTPPEAYSTKKNAHNFAPESHSVERVSAETLSMEIPPCSVVSVMTET